MSLSGDCGRYIKSMPSLFKGKSSSNNLVDRFILFFWWWWCLSGKGIFVLRTLECKEGCSKKKG